MYLHIFLDTIMISLSSVIPAVWSLNKTTSNYTLQLCGALVILYIVFRKFFGNGNRNFNQNTLTILVANSITQLLILSTGGISSPLFFLYYFLIFAFALIFESHQSLTVSIVTVIIYLFETKLQVGSTAIANLFSLILISPLASSFSRAMVKNLQDEGKITYLENNLEKEEVDSLLWLSTEAKPTLSSVINSVTELVIFLKSTRNQIQFPKSFLEKIKSIQTDLLTLYSSSEDLEYSIKELSDNQKK